MISLYVHIPFCQSKCAYCSFNSLALANNSEVQSLIPQYYDMLKQEITHYAHTLPDTSLKTLYIGGGTPSSIGVDGLVDLIEHIATVFDCENLAELSIELNPYPETEVLNIVRTLNSKYAKLARLRYSFGIQTFDDEILGTVGRAYSFASIVEFLRALSTYKQENTVFNFDFIAFGKFQVNKNGYKQLWHDFKRDFFTRFLASGYPDSISLYTLENIKHMPCQTPYYGSDEEIMEEFLLLKSMIEEAGFGRYEISNFAHAGKVSIHNMVYRTIEPYIGVGLSASSFDGHQRWTNTGDIKQYLAGNRKNEQEVQSLNASDLLIEEFFLRLRTKEGIADLGKFTSVLVPHYESLLHDYVGAGLVVYEGTSLSLSDTGMNVYNSIVTDLLITL